MPAPEVAIAYVSIVPSLRGFDSELRRQMQVPTATVSRTAGDNAGRSFGASFSKSIKVGLGAATKAVTGATALMAGSAAATGGALAAIPLAFAGIGIAAAAQSKAVQKSFTDLKTNVTQQVQGMSAPIASELLKISTNAEKTFDSIAPDLRNAFKAVAPEVGQLANGILGTVQNLAPALSAAVSTAAPVVSTIAGALPALGTSVGQLFTNLGQGAQGAAQGIGGLLSIVNNALPALGTLLGKLAGPGGAALKALATQVNSAVNALVSALVPAVTALTPVIVPLINALGAGLTPIIKALAPVVLTLANAIAAMAPGLVSVVNLVAGLATQIISALGPSLQVIATLFNSLSPLVSTIARVLGTALTPIISVLGVVFAGLAKAVAPLVVQLASQLGPTLTTIGGLISGQLGPLLTTLAPVVVKLAGAFATLVSGALSALVPLLPPILAALGGALAAALPSLVPAIVSLANSFALLTIALTPIIALGAQLIGKVLQAILPIIPPIVGLLAVIAPVVATVVGWLVKLFGGITDNKVLLVTVATAIAAIALALNAQAIATALVTGVFSAYRAAMIVGTAVTDGFAGAQALLSAVMDANPISLIIIAIVALVAAIVVIATKTRWFQELWSVVWGGIKTAALAVWNGALKPAFDGIVTAVHAVGSAAQWLYSNVLHPVFTTIATIAKWLYTAVAVVLIAPLILEFKALAFVANWLYTNAIKPAFEAIARVAMWLYTNGVKPVVDWIASKFKWLYDHSIGWLVTQFKIGIPLIGQAFKNLYTKYIEPAASWITSKFKWLYDHSVGWLVTQFKIGIPIIGNFFKGLYTKYIQPAIVWIANKVEWLWDKGVKPTFNFLKKGVSAIGDAFKSAANFIGKQWGRLENIAKAPVSFIVNTVYDKGIVPIWNKVASVVGGKALKTLHFATGGILPGYTPGRDVHLAALSGGEAVMRPEWTRAMGPGYVNAMNAAARSGGVGGVQALAQQTGMPAFSSGGIFGKIGGWVTKGFDWAKDTAAGFLKKAFNGITNGIPNLNTGFGKLVKGIPTTAVKDLIGLGAKKDKANTSNPPGSGVARWASSVREALAANHLSTSPSMVARILRQIQTESGGNPKAIQGNIGDINNRTGDLAKGLMQTISTTFNHYKFPGHGNIFNGYDNLLAALNYAKHRYGSSLSFLGNGHGYDSGGWLQPGVTTTVNKTGKPEAVFNPQQWSSISTLAERGASSGGLRPGDTIYLSPDGRTKFEAYVDQRADARIHAGITRPAQLGR